VNYKKSIIGSSVAFIIATSCCWLPAFIIAVGGAGTLVGLNNGLEKYSFIFIAIGIGFLIYGGYQFLIENKSVKANLNSTITCPECSHSKDETMPTNACQYFYECDNCNTILKPLENDCCVYCSYGTAPCPPMQLNQDCC